MAATRFEHYVGIADSRLNDTFWKLVHQWKYVFNSNKFVFKRLSCSESTELLRKTVNIPDFIL